MSTGKFREQQSHRFRNSEDKGRPGQRGGMIVRGAAVVMLRSTLVMVGRSVVVGDALRMRRDFPVLIGMNPLGHSEQRQADQPQSTEIRQTRHRSETKHAPP